MVPENWTAFLHTVIQGPRIFLSVAPPSPMACGHLNAAGERRRNLGLEATCIPFIYSLLSKTGHKKYLVTQPCLEAWGGGEGMGGGGWLENVPQWAFQLLCFAAARELWTLVNSRPPLLHVA